MNNFLTNLNNNLRLLLSMNLSDVVDVLVVAVAVYAVISFIRRTGSIRVAQGLLLLLVAMGLSSILKLSLTNFILRQVFEIGVLAMVVLFQPEIRRALEKVGSLSSINRRMGGGQTVENTIDETVKACEDMSASRTGALIVFERTSPLTSIIKDTGTEIDALVSAELLKNIFYKGSPLHDGAVIIRDGRLAAAGCMLPLTEKTNLSRELGTRHRAGLGMSERSDAVVVIVSEETGSISMAMDGQSLKRHLEGGTLKARLRQALLSEDKLNNKNLWDRLKSRKGNEDAKKDGDQ